MDQTEELSPSLQSSAGVEIPPATQEAWQQVVEITVQATGLPAAIMVRHHPASASYEIIASSKSCRASYPPGSLHHLTGNSWYAPLLRDGDALRICDASEDQRWQHSPELKQGMTAFMGLPLLWPNDSVFGAICIMDAQAQDFQHSHQELLERFQALLNMQLNLLFQLHNVKNRASHDPLTGAYTRLDFFVTGNAELKRARRYQESLCLLMLDLDHFKSVNDQYGHAAGDEVLCTVVQQVLQSLRSSDRIYRLGGEEFVVLLPHTELESGIMIAERTRKLLDQTMTHGGHSFPVSASIGVAMLESAGESLEELLEKVDVALYAAKNKGRNRVEVYQRH